MTYLDSIVDQLFWSKVSKTDRCWVWRGFLSEGGYGYFSFRAKSYLVHRFSWELANGVAVPSGQQVCHVCDNPKCVRPDHLQLGTARDNQADRRRKETTRLRDADKAYFRRVKDDECWRGHPLDEKNTYVDRKGTKICRTCKRLNQRNFKSRLRQARFA